MYVKYRQAVKLIYQQENKPLLDSYYQLGMVLDEQTQKLWSMEPNTTKYINQCKVVREAREATQDELRNILYTFMQTHAECFKRTIKPFYIKSRVGGSYIGYLTKRRYSYSCGPTKFTSRTLYNRVTMDTPYKDMFEVEFAEQ